MWDAGLGGGDSEAWNMGVGEKSPRAVCVSVCVKGQTADSRVRVMQDLQTES